MFKAEKISQALGTFLTIVIYTVGFTAFVTFILFIYTLFSSFTPAPMKAAIPPEIKVDKAIDVYFNSEIIGSRGVAIYNLHPKTLTLIERKGLIYLRNLKHGRDEMFRYDSWQIGAPDTHLCNQGGFKYRDS